MKPKITLDEMVRKITGRAPPVRPPMTREEIVQALRLSDALGDCGPEPEDIESVADDIVRLFYPSSPSSPTHPSQIKISVRGRKE